MRPLFEIGKKASVLLAVVCGFTGCTMLGPDYQEPRIDWAENWETDLYGQVAGSNQVGQADLRFWWVLFDDSVLNELIEVARKENPSLILAGLSVLESRATLGIADSARYPQIKQASGLVGYNRIDQSGGRLPDSDEDFTAYQAGLNLGWELDFWGRFRRGVESADAAFFSSIWNQRDAQVLLSAQVADLYYSYRTTLIQIEIAKTNTALQKRSYDITDLLYKSGEESELDLQQAKTQYLATKSSIPTLQIVRTQIRNAICVLLGRGPGDLPELDGELPPLPGVEAVLIESIPAELLMRRPDIRSAALQVAAQSAQIGIAEAELYPSVSLFGNVGWSTDSRDGAADTLSLGIGPSITWNLFDHGLIKNNILVQDARLQQAIERFRNSVLSAAKEIDDAAINIVKSHERQNSLDQSTVASRRALDLANIRFREGYSDFQRVLDAQRAVAAQAQQKVDNMGKHFSAVISLYKAAGGGWVETPVEELIPESMRTNMAARSDWGDLLNEPLPEVTYEIPVDSENVENEGE